VALNRVGAAKDFDQNCGGSMTARSRNPSNRKKSAAHSLRDRTVTSPFCHNKTRSYVGKRISTRRDCSRSCRRDERDALVKHQNRYAGVLILWRGLPPVGQHGLADEPRALIAHTECSAAVIRTATGKVEPVSGEQGLYDHVRELHDELTRLLTSLAVATDRRRSEPDRTDD
jgi:hypothetical protein